MKPTGKKSHNIKRIQKINKLKKIHHFAKQVFQFNLYLASVTGEVDCFDGCPGNKHPDLRGCSNGNQNREGES